MDLFVDTNVLLDHFGNRRPFCSDARRVLAMGIFGDARLWAAPQSFNDMFYILQKVVPSEAIQASFSRAYDAINICSVGPDEMALAAQRSWPDMEDCLVSICAEKVGARYLVTRNARGFARSQVKPVNPAWLLEHMREERGITYDNLPGI